MIVSGAGPGVWATNGNGDVAATTLHGVGCCGEVEVLKPRPPVSMRIATMEIEIVAVRPPASANGR